MTLDEIRSRFGELQSHIYALMSNFIVWNDSLRYPDMPPGTGIEALKRNDKNEFQVRYLAGSKENSIISDVSALLYDTGRMSKPNLQALAQALRAQKPSQEVDDCLGFLNKTEFREVFLTHRDKWVAHIDSVSYTDPDIIKVFPIFTYIYSVVPKSILLVELVHAEVEAYPTHYDNQFASVSRDVAGHLFHSSADDLLAELFSSRALPSTEFEAKVKDFVDQYEKRDKEDRLITGLLLFDMKRTVRECYTNY